VRLQLREDWSTSYQCVKEKWQYIQKDEDSTIEVGSLSKGNKSYPGVLYITAERELVDGSRSMVCHQASCSAKIA
jgi:hypothetical protein